MILGALCIIIVCLACYLSGFEDGKRDARKYG
jgi:hypothetical protein